MADAQNVRFVYSLRTFSTQRRTMIVFLETSIKEFGLCVRFNWPASVFSYYRSSSSCISQWVNEYASFPVFKVNATSMGCYDLGCTGCTSVLVYLMV